MGNDEREEREGEPDMQMSRLVKIERARRRSTQIESHRWLNSNV